MDLVKGDPLLCGESVGLQSLGVLTVDKPLLLIEDNINSLKKKYDNCRNKTNKPKVEGFTSVE